jgi:hypothetical protein
MFSAHFLRHKGIVGLCLSPGRDMDNCSVANQVDDGTCIAIKAQRRTLAMMTTSSQQPAARTLRAISPASGDPS